MAIQPFAGAGYVFGGPVEASNVQGGALAWIEMRAWDARLGATYDEARQLGLGGYGESSLFQIRAGVDSGVGPIPALLTGLQSFSLRAEVPEPRSFSLLLLGLPIMWLSSLRRRK